MGARAIALLLVFSMTASARGKSPVEKLLAAPPNAVVRITLNSGEKLTGRLASVDGEFYILRVALDSGVSEKSLRFVDTKKVHVERSSEATLKRASARTAVKTLTVFGVLVGVSALLGGLSGL